MADLGNIAVKIQDDAQFPTYWGSVAAAGVRVPPSPAGLAQIKPFFAPDPGPRIVRSATEVPTGVFRPQVRITTQVDGSPTAKAVAIRSRGGSRLFLGNSTQPLEIGGIYGQPTDVYFEVHDPSGVKRTEVWGPYTIAAREEFGFTGDFPDGTQGVAYSYSLTLTGDDGSITWQADGTLPPGLTFTGGTLSGTPTTPGTYRFTISCRDSYDAAIRVRGFVVVIS